MSCQESTVVKPGEPIRPFVDQDTVSVLCAKCFGVYVRQCKEFNSYDDRNFHVTTKSNVASSCVFKVLNAQDSLNADYIDAQNKMILHVAEKGFPTPRPLQNVQGQLYSIEDLAMNQQLPDTKKSCIVRLFEFFPGRILAGVPYTSHLMYEIGRMAGKLDSDLSDFRHAAHDRHRRIWNLSEIPKLSQFLYCIDHPSRQALVKDVMEDFENRVISKYKFLSKGTIHGDINETNILLTQDKQGNYNPCSIIDFGDSTYSYYVFEVAIFLMYMMIGSGVMDPITTAGHALAGYLAEFTIPQADLDVLVECIQARFIQSLVIGQYTALQDVKNAEYLLTTSQRGWDMLLLIRNMPNEDVLSKWNTIFTDYDTKKQ